MARYRRRYSRNRRSGMIQDTVEVANKLPWWGAAFLGVAFFSLFYWVLPAWMHSKMDELQGNMFRPLVEAIFIRRTHWVQWTGIAIGLVCAFFAIRNYFAVRHLDRREQQNVGWLARFLARFLD